MTTPLEAIKAARDDLRSQRVQRRYDELMAEGKHGHYETMFRVVEEETARTAHALLSQVEAAPAIPDGWQLVPKEPTVEQLEAMPSLPAIKLPVPENLKHLRPHQYQNRERYIAALAVAPTAPQSPAQVPSVEEVARVINPRAFESSGVLRGFAGFEAVRKKEQTNALEKATAILALFKGEKK